MTSNSEKDTVKSIDIEITIIPKQDFENLLKDSRFLDCLRFQGVDNWDGYQYAIDAYEEFYGEF